MVGSQQIDLPLIPITEELAIALLITVDHGVRFVERAGAELAEQLEPYELDLVVSVATMGIPLAIEVTRALGLDDYLILQKTPKLHLRDAISRAGEVHHDRSSAAAALRCRQSRRGAGKARRARRRRHLHRRFGARRAEPASPRRRRAGRDRHAPHRGRHLAPGARRDGRCSCTRSVPFRCSAETARGRSSRTGTEAANRTDWRSRRLTDGSR